MVCKRKKKKTLAGLAKPVINYYQTLANGETCQEVFLASSHTTSTAQSVEEPSRHKKSHTVPAVFTHKRTITVMGITV